MGQPDSDLRREDLKRGMREVFYQTLDERIERYVEVAPRGIIPNHHFAAASSECIELYRDGFPDQESRTAMNNVEARSVLRGQLQPWRERSWTDLRKEVGQSRRFELTAESGTWYQGDVQMFWDDKPGGAIRVMASVDDGGWRAFVPLTDSFILAPDGTFVGE